MLDKWQKKEKPVFTGITRGVGGFGFGTGGAGGAASDSPTTFTIYLWGAGADQRSPGPENNKAGITELTIQKSSIPGSYSRFEVIVGQEGNPAQETTARFGGGGGGAPQGGKPGGGGSFVFLSSPSSTNVFAADGLSISVPVPQADARCVGAAGGMGGEDTGDGGPNTPGGGLTVVGAGFGPEATKADRTNSSPGYIGEQGSPGSPWHSGGGGGGFAAGKSHFDYPGWGGSGFAGTTSPTYTQPFTGPSPINGLEYTLGNTIGNNPASTEWTAPTGAAPFRPANAGSPSNTSPVDDARGYVVIVDDDTGTATEFGYTGNIQYYNFPA